MDTEDTGEDVSLEIPIYVENDLEIDKDGNFNVQTFIYPDGEENPVEVRVKFSSLIQNVIEYYNEDASVDGTNTLYCIAHELSRQAEVLRSKGDYMDRGVYSDDLFKEETTEEDVIKKSNN